LERVASSNACILFPSEFSSSRRPESAHGRIGAAPMTTESTGAKGRIRSNWDSTKLFVEVSCARQQAAPPNRAGQAHLSLTAPARTDWHGVLSSRLDGQRLLWHSDAGRASSERPSIWIGQQSVTRHPWRLHFRFIFTAGRWLRLSLMAKCAGRQIWWHGFGPDTLSGIKAHRPDQKTAS